MKKTCKRCHKRLPVENFTPHTGGRLGYVANCRPCANIISRNLYHGRQVNRKQKKKHETDVHMKDYKIVMDAFPVGRHIPT